MKIVMIMCLNATWLLSPANKPHGYWSNIKQFYRIIRSYGLTLILRQQLGIGKGALGIKNLMGPVSTKHHPISTND